MGRLLTLLRGTVAPAGGGPVVLDTFSSGQTELDGRTCDTGQVWTVHTGSAQRGQGGVTHTFEGGVYRATVDCGASDGTLEVTLLQLGDAIPPSAMLVWRYQDANNYWYGGPGNLFDAGWKIYKVEGGVATQVAEQVGDTSPQAGYVYRVVLDGNDGDLYIEDVPTVSWSDSFLASETRHGIYSYPGMNDHPVLDDFSFTGQ